jgi:hypothetical protein
VNVPVEITDVAPPASGNNLPPFTAQMGITYIINTLTPTKSQLLIRNTSSPGNGLLTISVTAQEKLAPGQPPGTASVTMPISTLNYTLSSSYWAAMWPCISKPVYEASAWLTAIASLVPLLNAPDPSPEQITAVAAAAGAYLAALAKITGGAIGLQNKAASVISASQLPTGLPVPSFRPGVDGGLPILSVSSQKVRLQSGGQGETS